MTVTASGENLSEEFFAGTQEASVALAISDGNNSVTSEYIPMVTKESTDEIWYKTTDGQPLIPNKTGIDIFGANRMQNLRMPEIRSKKCKIKAIVQNLHPLFY